MGKNYISVTEIAGDEVTQEQIDRLCNRHYWAGTNIRCDEFRLIAAKRRKSTNEGSEMQKSNQAGET